MVEGPAASFIMVCCQGWTSRSWLSCGLSVEGEREVPSYLSLASAQTSVLQSEPQLR